MPFRDAAEEARFRALAAELRCVMCQNQSLADSSAPIARDLRNEVLELMQQGKSDDEIKAFLTERYSDFVLYRPPLREHAVAVDRATAAAARRCRRPFAVVRRRTAAGSPPQSRQRGLVMTAFRTCAR